MFLCVCVCVVEFSLLKCENRLTSYKMTFFRERASMHIKGERETRPMGRGDEVDGERINRQVTEQGTFTYS